MKVTRSQGHKSQVRKINIAFVVFVLVGLCGMLAGDCIAQEKVKKEIVIKVSSGIIDLGVGEAAKIPVSAARVRSTELRQLNKDYNVVAIEKLYKLKTVQKEGSVIKGLKSMEPVDEPAEVELDKIFTKEIKKEMQAAGQEVKELKNTYLFHCEFEEEPDMNEVLINYRALDVVRYAEYIKRTK
jgi:hypothetical protein